MTPTEIIDFALKSTGTTQKELARKLGDSYPALNEKLTRGTFKATFFLNCLDALGIDFVLRKKDSNDSVGKTKGHGEPFKGVADGVVYDSANSNALSNSFYADGINEYNDGFAEELYQDNEGRYFFVNYEDFGNRKKIQNVSVNKANAFIEKFGLEIEKQK